MDYEIVVTAEAENDMERYIRYLLVDKKSRQAAKSVMDDFSATSIFFFTDIL